MKTFDVVTIGASTQDTYISGKQLRIKNAKQSLTGKVEKFDVGAKVPIETFHIETGGGATNAAATFKRFGCEVSVLSVCGDDPSGQFVLRELKREGIDTQHIHVVRNGKTTYSLIFLAKNGERTILVYRGVGNKYTPIQKSIRTISTKWMYVSSLGGDMKTLRVIARRASEGVLLAWNPGVSELKKGIRSLSSALRSTSVLLLNWDEAKQLFSTSSERSIQRLCMSIGIPITVITKGGDGSVAFIGKRVFRTTIKKVRALDTTGAGDSFGSGFVAGLLNRPGDFSYALFVASANSMSNVLVPGAKHGLVTPESMRRFSPRIRVREV